MSETDAVPGEVVDRLVATVEELVDTAEVAGFLLGLSEAPEREATFLGADAVVEVFRSDVPEELRLVHRALTTRFDAHVKARTLAIDASPSPVAGRVGRVYVALWAIDDLPAP